MKCKYLFFNIAMTFSFGENKQKTPTSYQVPKVSTGAKTGECDHVWRLSWGHLWEDVQRVGVWTRLRVWGMVTEFSTLVFVYQNPLVQLANLEGRAAMVPKALVITDLACVSEYRASCQPWNNVHTISGWYLRRISLLILQKAKLTHCSNEHM